MTSYLTFSLFLFLLYREGLSFVEKNLVNTSSPQTFSRESLPLLESYSGNEIHSRDKHRQQHDTSLHQPLCLKNLSRKDPRYQLCSKSSSLKKKIRKSRRKSYKALRRTGRRKVHNKSLRCDRLAEISCSMSCVSANKICDGVRDCNDGRDERNCNELQLSLKGGKKRGEGRIEIMMNGFTGSLCGKKWTDEDASVFCRMSGYLEGGIAVKARKNGFGKGYGLVWSTKFNCKGNEEDLFECPLVKKQLKCSHSHDAAVVCHSQKSKSPGKNISSVAQCGIRQIPQTSSKIFGGKMATYGSQPWQARLVFGDTFLHLCGASIIDQKWVVTAAHCLKKFQASDFRVVVGDHSMTQIDAMEQVFRVKKAIPHPKYQSSEEDNHDYYLGDPFSHYFFPFKNTARSKWGGFSAVAAYNYDIALLKLDSYKRYQRREITFNKYVSPICLPSENTLYTSSLNCEVSGWGYNGKTKKASSTMKVAKLSLVKQSTCKRKYGSIFYNKITPQMVCAGSETEYGDTCQGDSGGPLSCQVNGVFTLMGVTSWGYECGVSTAPGIYTKVGVLRKWIDQTRDEN